MNNPLVVLTFVLLKNYLTFTLHFRVIPFAFTIIVALPFFLATTLPFAKSVIFVPSLRTRTVLLSSLVQ